MQSDRKSTKTWRARRRVSFRPEATPQSYITLMDYHAALMRIQAQYAFSNLNAFHSANLRILQSLCKRLDDAISGNFHTADELQLLIKANQLRKQENPSLQDLRLMKDAAALVVKQEKYLGLIANFNATGERSSFELMARKADHLGKRNEFNQVKLSWTQRKCFASLSTVGLFEIADVLTQLEKYVILLARDVDYLKGDTLSASYARYSYGLTAATLQELSDLVTSLQGQINSQRANVADAMLERLKLVPPDYLHAANRAQGVTFKDDVVFATLESLVQLNLINANYLVNFKKQASAHHTLTADLITRGNQFITTHGSMITQRRLGDLYRGADAFENSENRSASPQPQSDESIFIPLSIPGHYELQVRTEGNTDEFVYIAAIAKPAENTPQPNSLLDSFVNLPVEGATGNLLEISMVDMRNNERVVIPIVDNYVKVSVHDAKIRELYRLILSDEYSENNTDNFQAVYVANEQEEAQLKYFATRFKEQNNYCYYRDACRELLTQLDNKDVAYVCDKAFLMVSDEIMRVELEVLERSVPADAFLTHEDRILILRGLRDKFLSESKGRICFEDDVIKTSADIFTVIDRMQVQLLLKMDKTKIKKFVKDIVEYFSNQHFNDFHLAVSRAELDLFMSCSPLSVVDAETAKERILCQRNWDRAKEIWSITVRDLASFNHYKSSVTEDLLREYSRITKTGSKLLSEVDTNLKRVALSEAMINIDLAINKQEVQVILEELEKNQIYIQHRAGLSQLFNLFSPTPTDSKKNLAQIIEKHVPQQGNGQAP